MFFLQRKLFRARIAIKKGSFKFTFSLLCFRSGRKKRHTQAWRKVKKENGKLRNEQFLM